jgi:hypothetical protein
VENQSEKLVKSDDRIFWSLLVYITPRQAL